MTAPLNRRLNIGPERTRMGLDGPSVPVRVEPVKFPQPEPTHEPAEVPVERPDRKPEKVPA